jgi:hypothetical protein
MRRRTGTISRGIDLQSPTPLTEANPNDTEIQATSLGNGLRAGYLTEFRSTRGKERAQYLRDASWQYAFIEH